MKIFKIKLLAVLMTALMIISAFPAVASAAENVYAEIYIDPISGNDSASGEKDSPVKTIEKALSKVKSLRKTMTGDIYVWFADGKYELSEPLKFDATAGGKGEYNVYYKALPGAKPEISGGKKIEGWEIYDAEKDIYRAKTGGAYSRDFVVNGKSAIRARHETRLPDIAMDYGKVGITTSWVDMCSFKNPQDIECVFINNFYCKRILVEEIRKLDESTAQLVLGSLWKSKTGTSSYVEPRYIENALEFLDTEGEFYIDKKDEYIYYKPHEDQNMETADSYIPVLEDLITVSGYNYYNRAENIVIDGIRFMETTFMWVTTNRGWYPSQDGYLGLGANWSSTARYQLIVPSALTISKAKNIKILNCEFSSLGGSGIRVLEGADNVDIIGNNMYDIDSGAMFVGTIDFNHINPEDERLIVKNIKVQNNYIHHVAWEHCSSAAFSAGYPTNLNFSHNEIHNVPYSGAHIGWGWGLKTEKTLKDFVFEYNYIHDFLMNKQGDGGAIYCLGYTSPDQGKWNKIVNNYFKDGYSSAVTAGGMIYLDNTSSNWLIEGNVVDQIEGGKVWATKTFAMSSYTPYNNTFRENYSTLSLDRHVDRVNEAIFYVNNQYHPTANWPDKARNVINKAGLEPAYQHLNPRPEGFSKVFTDEFINCNPGDTHKLTPVITTEFCKELPLEKADIRFEIKDPSIATIDETGFVNALKEGQTEVTTYVTMDGVTKSAKTVISIGTGLAYVEITSGTPNKMIIGETKEIPQIAGVNYGGSTIEGKLENITFKSSDENVIAFDVASNTFTAKNYGEAVITFSGEYQGVTKSAEHKIQVIDYADQSGLTYKEPTEIDYMLEDVDSWLVTKGNLFEIANGLSFEQTAVATYTAEMYTDTLFDFNMSLDKQAVWPSVALRRQTPDAGLGYETDALYLICFANSGIELQRWNGETRTSLLCNLQPAIRVGPTHPMILAAGQKYHVQVGAFNEENGVRIILNIDGKNIINFLDEAEERVEAEGYFGLFINQTTMNLTTK